MSQLGWLETQYMGKWWKMPKMATKPPTRIFFVDEVPWPLDHRRELADQQLQVVFCDQKAPSASWTFSWGRFYWPDCLTHGTSFLRCHKCRGFKILQAIQARMCLAYPQPHPTCFGQASSCNMDQKEISWSPSSLDKNIVFWKLWEHHQTWWLVTLFSLLNTTIFPEWTSISIQKTYGVINYQWKNSIASLSEVSWGAS